MQQRQEIKKLQLHTETLKRGSDGAEWVQGGSISSPGCTVLTTCSPGCCDTIVT
jgi:hypothetical protein